MVPCVAQLSGSVVRVLEVAAGRACIAESGDELGRLQPVARLRVDRHRDVDTSA